MPYSSEQGHNSNDVIKLPPLRGLRGLFRLIPLGDGDQLLIATTHSLQLYSLSRGVTIHHHRPSAIIVDAVLLEPNFFATVHADRIVVYKLPKFSIKCMATLDKDCDRFCGTLNLGNGRVVLSTNKKYFHLLQWERSPLHVMTKLASEKTVDLPFSSAVIAGCTLYDDSRYQEEQRAQYFALYRCQGIAGQCEVVVVVFDSRSMEQVGTIRDDGESTITHVSISSKFLVTSSVGKSDDYLETPDLGFISVYSLPSLELQFVHDTVPFTEHLCSEKSDETQCLNVSNSSSYIWTSVLPNENGLFIGTKFLSLIIDLSTHREIWRQRNEEPIRCSCALSNNVLISVHHNMSTFEYKPLLQYVNFELYASKQEDGSQIAPAFSSTVLFDALSTCLTQPGQIPGTPYHKLIRYDRSRTSISEWVSAHLLLELAVRNQEVPRSTDFNGHAAWWFDQLYVAAREFAVNEKERKVVANCLRAAKQLGVVEGVETVLGLMRVSDDIRVVRKELQMADIFLFQRTLDIDFRLDQLSSALRFYHSSRLTSQLLCIALHIIPIVGGVAAGFIAAGQELVAGMTVKDIGDYVLGFGTMLATDSVSITDRMFDVATKALSDDALRSMGADKRHKLELVAEQHGFSLKMLRQLFRQEQYRNCGRAEEQRTNQVMQLDVITENDESMDGGSSGKTRSVRGPFSSLSSIFKDLQTSIGNKKHISILRQHSLLKRLNS